MNHEVMIIFDLFGLLITILEAHNGGLKSNTFFRILMLNIPILLHVNMTFLGMLR